MAARRATVASSAQSLHEEPQRRSTLHHQPITSLDDCKKKTLPENFAETILELEICLEDENVDISKIRELLEMYMIGVEYYESIGDQRFIYFNKKMSSLMMKPNVIDSMSRQADLNHNNEQPKSPTKTKEESQRGAEARQKEEQIRKTLVYAHQDNDEKAKALVKTVEQDMKSNQKIIHDQLDVQKRTLFERLKNRRAKTLTKAYSVPVIVADTQSQGSDNDESPQDKDNNKDGKNLLGEGKITGGIDFSAISNVIREDEEEAEDQDNEEQTKKNTENISNIVQTQLQIEIAQFKEKMLNYDTYSPVHISKGGISAIRNQSNTVCVNKARSSSNAEYMRKRNSTAQKRNRDKKQSISKISNRKRQLKPSKSADAKRNQTENEQSGFEGISIEELRKEQKALAAAQKVIISCFNGNDSNNVNKENNDEGKEVINQASDN